MEQEKAETLVTYQAKGYGLKNVNDRIRLLYGEESYGIQIYQCTGRGYDRYDEIPEGEQETMKSKWKLPVILGCIVSMLSSGCGSVSRVIRPA